VKNYVPFCSDVGEQLGELLDLIGDGGEIELAREEIRHLQQEQPRECGRDEAVVHRVTESGTVILRAEEDGQTVRGGVLGLEREFTLLEWHFVPGDTTKSDADKPEFRIVELASENLDEQRILVHRLS